MADNYGVQIGLKDLYYAKLVSDDSFGATYTSPTKIIGAVQANINPNASMETLFADDGPMETAASLGQISLELIAADLPLDVQAALLGHTVGGDGVMLRKASDVPPWVAIGFKSLKSNGKYRFVWLVKGKFSMPEQKHETKGDKVAFQTPTIQGAFVKRDYDDVWQKITDEDGANYTPAIGAVWFTAVEQAPDVTPPTISTTVPADGAAATSVDSTIVWNFDEAIPTTLVTSGNFVVYDDVTQAAVAGVLSTNTAKTQVVFTPTSDLTAGTKYWAMVTTGVTDLAGNPLAAAEIISFTTAS